MSEAIEDQIREYENQLADVVGLLEASPTDESLISLKSDLEELLAITRQSLQDQRNVNSRPTADVFEKALEAAFETSVGQSESTGAKICNDELESINISAVVDGTAEPPKKKSRKIKEFEIPDHLIPRDNDSEAEKNRKRRAIKALKSKHRQEMKEIESQKKQKSWQSFQKKNKIKDKSIFSTSEDDGTKVGVVATSSRQSGRT